MDSEKRDFLYDLADFCYSSMNWCAIESEKATGQVNEIITILLEDATRVSAISISTAAMRSGSVFDAVQQ